MLWIKGKDKKIEWFLKEYRKKVEKSQQLKRLKDLQEFEKPSITRRREALRAKHKSKNNDKKF